LAGSEELRLADRVVDFGFEGVVEAFFAECVTGFGALKNVDTRLGISMTTGRMEVYLQNSLVATIGFALDGHNSLILSQIF
jgi:hypothetical protein